METTLLVAGIAFVGAAIIGGGLKAFQVEVPAIQTTARQAMLGVFGVILIGLAFAIPAGDSASGNGGSDAGDFRDPGRSTEPIPDRSRPAEDPVDLGPAPDDCRIHIHNPLSEIKDDPDPMARGIRIDTGWHPVLASTSVERAGTTHLWFRIRAAGREGWIRDSSIFIDDRTAACP